MRKQEPDVLPEEAEGFETTLPLPEQELPVTERDRNELELVAAIKAGDIDNVRRLVDEPEIYINFEDPVSGLTPLQLAAQSKDIGILRQVLKHNDTYVDITDIRGNTSLHIALAQREISVAELLIKHGAAVNRVDGNGHKPIYSATKKRDKYAVALLLRSGADPELRNDSEGHTALELAQSIGAEDIATLLTIHQKEKAKVKLSLNDNLHLAVSLNDIARAEKALTAGADVNTRNILGSTTLHKALDDRSLRVLPPLLYHWSADIEATDNYGNTPLALAVSLNDPKSAELLLDRGASTSAINRFNEQPIHIAARVGSIEHVELLAKRGADITVKGGIELQTPLEIATASGHFDVAERLTELSKPPAMAPEPSLFVHISSSACPPSGLQPARTALTATALSFAEAPTPTASITHPPQGYQKTSVSGKEQLHGLGLLYSDMPICLPKIQGH